MAEETENTPEEGVAPGLPDEAAAEAVEAAAESEATTTASDSPATPPAPSEPQLAPKERRARARAARAAKAPAARPRTPEERQEERKAERAQKAGARRVERERSRAKHKEAAHERSPTPAREHEPGRQKTRQGIVVSDKAEKTITVRIDVARRHRRYQKIVRTSSTLHAHDEQGEAHIGDTVLVRECRPLSRTKRWRLVEVLERAE
jgi:small subunit ribosomal protein S17